MGIRLVIADDHRMLREGLRRSMTDEGFVVAGEASNGEEAVALCERLVPDVALFDITMPVVDGVEAIRRVRRTLPDLPILVLSMHTADSVVAGALRAGATGYLVKDCSIEEIASSVRLAAAGETLLSPAVAASMLAEVHKLEAEPGPAAGAVSPREVEVLQLVADGCSTPEIAAALYISQKTVKNHLASIYAKLDARDRTQAVLRAVRMGIVQLS